MATGTSIPAVPVGIAPPLRIVLESVRTALADHEKRLQDKERELRTLRELLRAQTAAGDGVVLLDETMPAVTNYQMRQHPNHVMFVLPALPFVLLAGNPVPQRVIAQLYRGLEDDNSTVLSLVDETQGLALEDHPPAGVRYRYFLRFRAPDYSKSGPMTPPEGIAFTNLAANPEESLPPGEGGVFLETFEARDLLARWANVSGTNPVIDFPENGLFGGIVARLAGGEWWGVHRDLIPYDPNTLYRITAGVKRTVDSGGGAIYVGVTGVASDGETLINTVGGNSTDSQHYVAAAALTPAVGTYTEYSGYFKGLGNAPFGNANSPASPTPLYTGIRFIRPTVIVNSNAGTGTTEVDYVRIDALTPWMGWTPVVTNGGGASMLVTGTEIRKSGGINAWDSQVYSRESYAAGCALSFRPLQADKYFMVGLNTDPATDADWTGLDYAIYCEADGTFNLRESGAIFAPSGSTAYDTSTTFSITYDGAYIRYLKNGAEVRKVPRIGERFYLDSSWSSPGAAAAAIQFVPLTPAPNTIALIVRGNCVTQGHAIQKAGGISSWDSDCYSLQAYAGGCAVSWKSSSDATSDCMIGLNSDPASSEGFTSLDYAIETFNSAGYKYSIFENGTAVLSNQAGAAGDAYSIEYDGQWVRYYRNGALVREKADPGKTFFLDSSFYAPGSMVSDVTFGPLTTATPDPFIARGNCEVSGSNIIKQGGAAAWDSDCYSIVGYPVCHVSWKANSATVECGVGLTTDPTADQSYTSIDYWIDNSSSGQWNIYENGFNTGVGGTYTATDVFAVTYDGATVTYWKNNVSLRTVAVAGLTLFMDSSFYSPGSGINSLRFGPTTNLAVADTAQIGSGAATSTSTTYVASHTTTSPFGADTTWLVTTTVAQPVDHTIQVTASGDFWKTAGSAQRTVEIFAVPSPGGPPFYGSAPRDIVATASPGDRIALQADFPALANTQYIIRVALTAPGGGAGTVDCRDASLRVEHIKR